MSACTAWHASIWSDTCISIAAEHGISVHELLDWNPILGAACPTVPQGSRLCVAAYGHDAHWKQEQERGRGVEEPQQLFITAFPQSEVVPAQTPHLGKRMPSVDCGTDTVCQSLTNAQQHGATPASNGNSQATATVSAGSSNGGNAGGYGTGNGNGNGNGGAGGGGGNTNGNSVLSITSNNGATKTVYAPTSYQWLSTYAPRPSCYNCDSSEAITGQAAPGGVSQDGLCGIRWHASEPNGGNWTTCVNSDFGYCCSTSGFCGNLTTNCLLPNCDPTAGYCKEYEGAAGGRLGVPAWAGGRGADSGYGFGSLKGVMLFGMVLAVAVGGLDVLG